VQAAAELADIVAAAAAAEGEHEEATFAAAAATRMRARAEKLTALLVDSLWDATAGNGHDIGRVGVAAPPSGGNFVNRLPGRAYPSVDGGSDVFYQRVSPTSFYPLVGPSSCIPPNGTLTVATSSR